MFSDIRQGTELDGHCKCLSYNMAHTPREDQTMSENTVVRARIDEHIKEEEEASTVLTVMEG